MSNIVSVSLRQVNSLRKEGGSTGRKEIIGSGFTARLGANVEPKRCYFTSDGTDEVDLVIDNVLQFNLDNKVEAHNWKTLQLFCKMNPDTTKHLLMVNPQEVVDKELQFAEQSFEVQKFLRDHSTDDTLLAQIYRRLIGLAGGLPSKTIFTKLDSLARTEPAKFMRNGKLIVETPDFELMALLDVAVEKGVVLKDTDGKIRKDRDTIYAKSQEDAAFQLRTDVDFKVYLQRGIDPKYAVAAVESYEPKFEDSDFVKLMDEVGKGIDAKPLDEQGEKDDEEMMLIKFDEFLEAGLMEKEGKGFQMKYLIPSISTEKYSKKDLMRFFQANEPLYNQLKEQSLVK